MLAVYKLNRITDVRDCMQVFCLTNTSYLKELLIVFLLLHIYDRMCYGELL